MQCAQRAPAGLLGGFLVLINIAGGQPPLVPAPEHVLLQQLGRSGGYAA
jgi:hypothetical protein